MPPNQNQTVGGVVGSAVNNFRNSPNFIGGTVGGYLGKLYNSSTGSAPGLTPPATNGQKAAQPGGLSTGQTNTLPNKYAAPNQVAAGTTTNTANTATLPQTTQPGTPAGGAMGAVMSQPLPPAPTASLAVSQTAPAGPTYGSVASTLANTSALGSPAAQGGIGATAGASQNTYGQGASNTQNYLDAAQQQYQQLEELQNRVAKGIFDSQTRVGAASGEFVQGQERAIQEAYGGQEQAAAGAIQSLLGLAGVGSGLQSTGIQGLGTASGQALTEQQLRQQGLQAAGQLYSPGMATQQVGQGTTVLNAAGQPVASTPVIGPVGTQQQYQVPLSTFTGGQPNVPAAPAYSVQQGDTFNALASRYGTTAAAISQANPGVDPNNLQVGQRINLPQGGQQGSPYTAGQVAGQVQLGEQTKQNEGTIGAAQFVQNKINQDILQNNINPSALAAANFWNQWIQGQVSNPAYANFANDLSDYAATIAPLIGFGGNITDAKTAIANHMTVGTAQGSTIMDVLNNLNSLALGKNQAFAKAGQSGQNPTGAPSGQSTITYNGTQMTQDSTGRWVKVQ